VLASYEEVLEVGYVSGVIVVKDISHYPALRYLSPSHVSLPLYQVVKFCFLERFRDRRDGRPDCPSFLLFWFARKLK